MVMVAAHQGALDGIFVFFVLHFFFLLLLFRVCVHPLFFVVVVVVVQRCFSAQPCVFFSHSPFPPSRSGAGDFLFDTFQPFHFYYKEEDGVDYKLPPGCDRNSLHYNVYKELIDSLPMKNSPEVFGLHANAEIGYNTNSTRQIWADLIELQPRSTGGSGGEAVVCVCVCVC